MQDQKEIILHLIEGIPFFDGFSHNEIGILLEKGSWINGLPGQRIITEGEIDFRMFVLVVGQAEVVLNGKVMAVLGTGDIFGEYGLMGSPRTAHVEAKKDCTILSFDADHLNDLPLELQLKLLKSILSVMIARLQKINKRDWLQYRTRMTDTSPIFKTTKMTCSP